ncbi:hypothetical protein LP419_32345 [Massilia sp. H-1]|nr:hypothetical protein LP419_32345 [Massilia sp. H-1]
MSHRTKFAAALLLALAQPAIAANNYPVVLVHGFLGFGPEQYKRTGFKYWGGFDDIAEHMRHHQGEHQILAASVGSISSSWDRSAELYYQIKGGCVDYGSVHTTRADHVAERRPPGKCWATDPSHNPNNYPIALYPAWDAQHPVHLIGHSQGGQTIRALIQLLEHGSPHGDEGGGELYQGGKSGWVASATTLAAPHDGTSLRDAMTDFGPFIAHGRWHRRHRQSGRQRPRARLAAAAVRHRTAGQRIGRQATSSGLWPRRSGIRTISIRRNGKWGRTGRVNSTPGSRPRPTSTTSRWPIPPPKRAPLLQRHRPHAGLLPEPEIPVSKARHGAADQALFRRMDRAVHRPAGPRFVHPVRAGTGQGRRTLVRQRRRGQHCEHALLRPGRRCAISTAPPSRAAGTSCKPTAPTTTST